MRGLRVEAGKVGRYVAGQRLPSGLESPKESLMSNLFSPIQLRGLKLANRIMVAPMCQYSSDDGDAND